MNITQKNRKSLTHSQVTLLCAVIAILSFGAGITLVLHRTPTPESPDTYITEPQDTENEPSTTDENKLKGIHDMPANSMPSTNSSSSAEEDIITSNNPYIPYVQNPTSVTTTKCREQETDEEIMQNPDSYDRFKTIDNRYNFHNTIQFMYFNGAWDGEPMVFDRHYISISESGYICADMHRLISQKTVDLPLDFDTARSDDCNTEYIPGKGTYFVDDETYIYCYKGMEAKLGKLNWKDGTGIDVEYHHPFIHYDDVTSKMFLWTPMIYSYNVVYDYTYLYIFPDYDKAKIEFVAQVKDFDFNENGFEYIDMDNNVWRYTNQNGKDEFVKVSE